MNDPIAILERDHREAAAMLTELVDEPGLSAAELRAAVSEKGGPARCA